MKRISILTIVFVVLVSNFAVGQDSLKNITLEDIWTNYSFYPRSIRGINSLNDGKHYTMNKRGTIIVYDYKSGDSVATLVRAEDLMPEGAEKPIKISSFTLSKDETKFLIPSETEAIYRHSSQSKYYIWDTQSEKLALLSSEKQRLADFAPDGNKVAFIRDNNIFVKNLETGSELQITKDGAFNSIINGTCDWVYEEEFGFTKAFFWSPDGKKIAYYRFDESKVKEYTITNYGDLYPELYTYKYPKAGEDNSIVEIFVFDIVSGQTIKMDIGDETDQYIPRIKWTNDPSQLAIQRLNRLQNHLDILLADASSGKSQNIYSEDNKYYIDITDNLTFLPGDKQFILTSEKDGYNHIYLNNTDGTASEQLTSGNWDVRRVYGYNAKKKQVFYQASEDSPLVRDIYKVDLKGKRTKISSKEGTNDAAFSMNYNYFINTWKDAATPPVITVNLASGKEVRMLEDNSKLFEKMLKYNLGRQEFFTISSPEFTLPDGQQVDLNAWAIYPPDFDKTKKYPVLITIYGGPGSQEVTNSFGYFNYFWYQMLAQNGIIVVSVDNRGTGARGEEFKKMTYLELGKYETIDYIETAKYLGSLDYIDENRIGIFGWSYGGFMAANALFQGADYFNTAIAVAPVTNWRYYDNIYTERFMRTPQENPDGYDNNSPINHVKKMKGNFLLVHGSADDNVHFQNTMDLVTALVNENKQFELMAYPNKNHGIYGGNTRYHLFKKMTDFLYENLKE